MSDSSKVLPCTNGCYHDLDKRMTILEMGYEGVTGKVEGLSGMKDEIMKELREHERREESNQRRLMMFVITTLLAAVGSFVMTTFNRAG